MTNSKTHISEGRYGYNKGEVCPTCSRCPTCGRSEPVTCPSYPLVPYWDAPWRVVPHYIPPGNSVIYCTSTSSDTEATNG